MTIASCTLCPHCGHDLTRDEPISRGDIVFDPRGEVQWRGAAVHLTVGQRIVLHSLLKANGRTVPRDALLERLDSQSEDGRNLLSVHLARLRSALPGVPIENVRGIGLRWAA